MPHRFDKTQEEIENVLADNPLISSTPTARSRVAQAGAICYRRNGKRVLCILLIGSQRNGRWGLPKGHLVAVRLLEVTGLSTEFPEKTVRRQKWCSLKAAVGEESQPGLRALLAKLEAVAS